MPTRVNELGRQNFVATRPLLDHFNLAAELQVLEAELVRGSMENMTSIAFVRRQPHQPPHQPIAFVGMKMTAWSGIAGVWSCQRALLRQFLMVKRADADETAEEGDGGSSNEQPVRTKRVDGMCDRLSSLA
jgi:hypothetical protein